MTLCQLIHDHSKMITKSWTTVAALYFTFQFNCISLRPSSSSTTCEGDKRKDTFLYFAYGSNLLAQRIHINNPSAIRVGSGRINDYQLDFVGYSQLWKGAPATIVKQPGTCVWGALWQINVTDLEALDRQEGVNFNIYVGFDVDVEQWNNTHVKARTYQQTLTPNEVVNIEDIPCYRRPSVAYLDTILKGAAESGLPSDYQTWLKRIPHNDYTDKINIL